MSPKRLGLLALMYYKSGKNYLANSDSTVEQLAVGYFCEHKSVNGILDAIRNKLKLDESSNWRRSVRKLFKKKDKTLNAERVKEKKKKTSFTETDDTDSKATAKNKNKKVQQKSEANGKSEKPEKSPKKQKQQVAQENAEQDKSEESDDSSKSDDDTDVKSTKENDVSEPPPTTVDEFFITADGSNYLSTAVVNRNQEEDSDGNDNQHFYQGKDFERKPREASFFHKSDKKPVKPSVNRFEGTKRKWSNESEEQVHKSTEKKIDTELHPSWLAKQKLKPTITEFKGKKIKFD